jgi:hypothetical protein
MHHQEQSGEIPGIDCDRNAVGQLYQRLGRDARDFKHRVDVSRRAGNLDRVGTIDFGNGVNRFVEISGAHGTSLAF